MAEEADEAQTVSPFKFIQRGEDTLDDEGNVMFADFTPKIVPSETPDEIEPAPKVESAPEPAPSPESTQTSVQRPSETPVPEPAEEAESGSPTSSSDQKNG